MATKEKNKKTKPTSKKGTAVKPERGKGRPTKLTPQVIKDFTDAVAEGAGYALASRWAKISEPAALLWMREGRREQERRDNGETPDKTKDPYLNFLMAVREAEAEVGITWQQVVNRSAKSDPAWADRMLKYRFPADYIKIAEDGDIKIPEDMTVEYLDRIIAGESPAIVVREWHAYQRQLVKENDSGAKDKNPPTA